MYDRGAYVLDVDVNSGVFVNDERRKFESDWNQFSCDTQRVLGTRALSQTQQDHETE